MAMPAPPTRAARASCWANRVNAGAYPTVTLLAGRHKRIKSGHPWAYSNEVAMTAQARALEPGALVRLAAESGESMGVAGFNPHSLIAARILDRDADTVIDAKFLAGRLAAALALRERLYDAPYYRLVHAEADGLPGLVVDRFGDSLAVQLNTAVMDRLRDAVLDALDAALAPGVVVLRNDSAVRRLEGLDTAVETARGACGGPVELREGAIRFLADLTGGQKTGWFYDQRDNRVFAGGLARDGRVLDVYCHTGGFALHAAAGGARDVLALDRSAAALALAEQAVALNGFGAAWRFLKADAFTALERLGRDAERFDLVIADPPAFVKSRKDIKPGLRAYRKLSRLCAGLVSPGGFLFIASCSYNVAADAFEEQIGKGLADARRGGRILRRAGAGPDHPVHPWLPESAYLKSLVLQLD